MGALLSGLTWRVITDAGAQWTATGFAAFAAILAWVLWINSDESVRSVFLLDWVRSGTMDAPLLMRIDAISVDMMVIVTTLSALCHLFALGFMERDKAFDEGRSFRPRFFAYMSLFSFSMLLLVSADNLVQILLGLQLSGVMAYLLISFRTHYKSANAAAIKSLVVGALGHGAMILGVAALYHLTDSVMLDDIFAALPDLGQSTLIFGVSGVELSSVLILLGACAVSAQVLLHVWLPDAMEAPSPAAALLSAAYVMAGAFVVWRLSPLFEAAPWASGAMVWVGLITAVLMSLVAMAQSDIKRTMGFIASAQMGMIFVALGLGLGSGPHQIASVQIALFATTQGMLVLCVGAITRAMDDSRDLKGFGGLRKKLPNVAMAMTLGALVATAFGVTQAAVVVFAPQTGNLLFVSLYGLHPIAFWGLCCAAGLSVFAMWRVVFLSFGGSTRAPADVYDAVRSTPLVMVAPLAILGLLLLGTIAWEIETLAGLAAPTAPSWISVMPLVFSLAGVSLAIYAYIWRPGLPKRVTGSIPGVHAHLQDGFHLDTFFDVGLVAPLKRFGRALAEIGDERVFDAPFQAVSTRLTPPLSKMLHRRYGGLLLAASALVFFGLIAVITWTVMAGGVS